MIIFLLPFGLLALLKEIKVGSYSFAFQTGYVNSQSAGEIAKKFIGEQIIGGEVKVAKVTDEGSLYSFELEIPNQGNFTSYITKDGRFIFPGGYDLKQFAQNEKKHRRGKSERGNSQKRSTHRPAFPDELLPIWQSSRRVDDARGRVA